MQNTTHIGGTEIYLVKPNLEDNQVRPLEDYCVYVDLMVEIPETVTDGSVVKNNITYLAHSEMNKVHNSFQSGTTLNVRPASDVTNTTVYQVQALTTSPYEFTTVEDILQNSFATTECFGITSVDIEYNNYAVPQVTIQMTDIRGISLFGAEEHRHNKKITNENGLTMEGGTDPNIKGSFFKAFFMFPYPKFYLYVKGLYGKGTKYTLSCSDFKASFDSNSGNFNATVKFVGYDYAMLNDVSTNALIAAPYETKYGQDFWENKNFQLEDLANKEEFEKAQKRLEEKGVSKDDMLKYGKMPTLAKLIDLWHQLSNHLNDTIENTEGAKKVEANNTLGGIYETLTSLTNSLESLKKLRADEEPSVTSSTDGLVITYRSTLSEDEKKTANDIYTNLQTSIKEAINQAKNIFSQEEIKSLFTRETVANVNAVNIVGASYSTSTPIKEKEETQKAYQNIAKKLGIDTDQVQALHELSQMNASDFDVDVQDNLFEWLTMKDKQIWIKNADKLSVLLEKMGDMENIHQQQEQAYREAEQERTEIIVNALGFKPHARNICRILLAHLETLNYCIYRTAEDVNTARTMSSIGLSTTDRELINGQYVGPFPRVLYKDEDGTKEGWLGDLSSDEAEVTLIKGLIAGTKRAQEIITKYQGEGQSGSTEDNNNSTDASTDAVKFAESTAPEIKSSLYKYIKNLYDRWLSGVAEESYALDKFQELFVFMDCYYQDVGNKILIDVNELCKDIIDCIDQSAYSLMSTFSNVYSKVRFSMNTVQNFLGKRGHVEEDIDKLFTPIPFEEYIIDRSEKVLPYFVFIYTYETSKKLDDAFDLADDGNIPDGMKTSYGKGVRYPVPAFEVNYGQQNQSYFINIDVNMDVPIVTEQSICATFQIAGLANPNSNASQSASADGKSISLIGQDLFTIYSNNSYSCNVTMLGCAYIQPLMYFQLNNVPMFHGAYLIEKVSHSITPGDMKTKFLGVRMARVPSEIAKNWANVVDNGRNSGYSDRVGSDTEYSNATIDMDCAYSTFPIETAVGGLLLSRDEYNMTLEDYASHKGSTWDKCINLSKTETTIKDLLIRTAFSEASGNDKDFIAAHLNVLYNRWITKGKNFCSVYKSKQHSFKDSPPNESSYAVCQDAVEEIFLRNPSYLVGQIGHAERPIATYYKGKKDNEVTSSKTINELDVQTVHNYCTWRGYDLTYTGKQIREKGVNPNDTWHSGIYRFSDYDSKVSSERTETVFTSTGETSLWPVSPPENNAKESASVKGKRLKEGLFAAIQQTLRYCNDEEYKAASNKIGMLPRAENIEYDPNHTFWIGCKPSVKDKGKVLAIVFDVLLNGYSNNCSKIQWIVNNDMSEAPSFIMVKVAESTNRKFEVAIRKYNDSTIYDATENLEAMKTAFNTNFVKSIKKHYRGGSIKIFQSEVLNCKLYDKKHIEKLWSLVTLQTCRNSNGEITNYSGNLDGYSHTVTNEKMKRVLSNVGSINSEDFPKNARDRIKSGKTRHIESTSNGEWVIFREEYNGCCTSGPTTWYGRAGQPMKFWDGTTKRQKGHYDYNSTVLAKNGFVPVAHGDFSWINGLTSQQLRPGDVGTLYQGTKGRKSQHGMMWTGKDWRSDAIQNRASCYHETNLGDKSAILWRHSQYQEPGKNVAKNNDL